MCFIYCTACQFGFFLKYVDVFNKLRKNKTENSFSTATIILLLHMHRHWSWLYRDYTFYMPATQHKSEEWRGALRGLATVVPPAEMRGEVRAKERGVWRSLTNRLCAGNRTNHGNCSGLCCSLFLCNSSLFSYILILFTFLFLNDLSLHFSPLLFLRCLPHESCDWA